jgi:hypothetical protein
MVLQRLAMFTAADNGHEQVESWASLVSTFWSLQRVIDKSRNVTHVSRRSQASMVIQAQPGLDKAYASGAGLLMERESLGPWSMHTGGRTARGSG